jgi:subtilisin family serine protease
MNRTIPTLAKILAASLFASVAVLSAKPARIYVEFAPSAKNTVKAAVRAVGGQVHYEFDELEALAVSVPEQSVHGLSRNPNIVGIEVDPTRHLTSENVPYGVTMVQAPETAATGADGTGIVVGVIDSGVYTDHEDFFGVSISGEPGSNPAQESTWFRDLDGHGTHVVGTIAAAANGIGVVGVSPGKVGVYMVKVFGDEGTWIYSSDLLTAAQRAVNNGGADILSMSLGGSFSSRTEMKGLKKLYDQGVLLVAAAGNDGNNRKSYPASYNSVISVAAIDSAKVVADFSQQNSQVELAAPGVDVVSTVPYIEDNTITTGGSSHSGNHIEFSARGSATATIVNGGRAISVGTWAGNIVLVERGDISFYEKVQNVEAGGGIAAVIYNNEPGNFLGTLGAGNSSGIVAISLSQEDGSALLSAIGSTGTVTSTSQQNVSGYTSKDGTSMATPHVSGAAALIWSGFPAATNIEVRQALTSTAEDLGEPGRDSAYGYGLVQAADALLFLSEITSGDPGGGDPGGGDPGGGSDDTVAPIISGLVAFSTHHRNGSFAVQWATDEPATSDIQLGSQYFPDSELVTAHDERFKGRRGALYVITVTSTDAAGNTSDPATIVFLNQ